MGDVGRHSHEKRDVQRVNTASCPQNRRSVGRMDDGVRVRVAAARDNVLSALAALEHELDATANATTREEVRRFGIWIETELIEIDTIATTEDYAGSGSMA